MKAQLHLLLLGLILAGCAPAQSDEEVPATDTATSGIQVEADVIYGRKLGMALTFDLYRPDEPNGAGILFVNSGAWQSPSIEFYSEENGQYDLADVEVTRQFSFQALLDNGFSVFDLRHGSSPKFVLPEIVNDLRHAIRFIRATAPDYDVDPNRLALWGWSAGGHLALLLGSTPEVGPEDPEDSGEQVAAPVAAVVAYAAPSDLPGFAAANTDMATRWPALAIPQDLYRELSPAVFATPDDPPTLLIHGDQDTIVQLVQSETMRDALTDAGVITELIVVEGSDHVFRNDDGPLVAAEALSWFQRHLE